MLSFSEYFLESVYTPRDSDVFYHGSVLDFEPSLITGNAHKDGLVYLTRKMSHVLDYAQTHNNFGSHAPVTKGFVYVYKIKPDARIFDSTKNRNHWGDTEVMQNSEDRGETVFKLLQQGYDGILQKQADLDSYGNYQKRSVKRSQYDKREKSKDTWREKVPFESGFRGTTVVGVKPEFLVPFKKIPLEDALNGLYPDVNSSKESRKGKSDFYKSVKTVLESYDTVQDFLSNPVHNDKEIWEWREDFEASGGKMLGAGAYGQVYYHPKWPYVVKLFSQDDPYIKFLRWSAKNPHSAFPKMYGTPKRVIPPYKRKTTTNDKFYAVRLEKLNKVDDEAYKLFDQNRHRLSRYFYANDHAEEYASVHGEENRQYAVREMYRVISDLPPEVVTACYGYYLLGLGNVEGRWGDEDLHQGNVMQRDDGSIVLADPVWYGYNPYAEADHQRKMEMDYYGYDDDPDAPEPKVVRGGKLTKPIRKKKVKPEPVKPQPEPSDDDIPF